MVVVLTALVVTDNQNFFGRCESAFNEHNVYARLSSFFLQEVLKKLETIQPDILLIESTRQGKAAELLESLAGIRALGQALFLYIERREPNWEQYFLRKGAMYIFDQGMHEQTMVECLLLVYTHHQAARQKDDMMPELVRILRDCCVSPRHRGYICIFDSVQLIQQYPALGQSITKEIYPTVARKNNTTDSRAEKNIRDAIKSAWENGGRVAMPEQLGCGQSRPPTNSEFILAVCEKLREKLYEKDRAPTLSQSY